MFSPKITIARKSGSKALKERLAKIGKMASYVGVPAAKSTRKGEKINNAELLYVLSKGSPARHLPATPWLEPAIAAAGNREAIAHELAGFSKAILNDKPNEAIQKLRRAGTAGQNAAQSWPTDPRNGWPRLAPSTEKARMRKMQSQPKVLKETQEKLAAFNALDETKQAEALAAHLGAYPFTRNVDSGALLRAIIHVEREDQ